MANKLPKTLYHYCNVNTFFNIIETNSIWLSDIEKSNDTLELSYIKKEYSKYLPMACYAFADYHKQNNMAYESIRLDALLQVMNELQDFNVIKVWAFCLSEKGDLLSQWRGYADDGDGISLGFKASTLNEIVESLCEVTQEKESALFLEKINYSEKQMTEMLKTTINIDECAQCKTARILQEKLVEAISKIETIAPCYKSPSFKEEKEWRIIFESIINPTCDYMKINESIDSAKIGNFSYRANNENLISHFELKFVDLKKAVHKIILGPKCKISIDEMKCYLISKGLLKSIDDKSILIETSCSSYR